MTPQRGNPYLQVRLPQETIDDLKAFVGEGDGGKAGGVSLFVRRLIYREIDREMPPQWGQEATTMADLFALRRQVRAGDQGPELLHQLLDQVNAEEDPVRLSFLREIVGEFSVRLFEDGALKVDVEVTNLW